MSDELTAQPFWVQSYYNFCKYANFACVFAFFVVPLRTRYVEIQ